MEKLNGDLVIEIFSRLPVKDATRCKVLNKTFYSYIFGQNFEHKYFTEANMKVCDQVYFTYWYPSDYHRINLNLNPLKPTKYSRKMDTTSARMNAFPTLASCGGLLLLDLKDIKTYCVVNPITQEYQLVPHHIEETGDWSNGSRRLIGHEIGLAVDLLSNDGSSSYRCTLVAVEAKNKVLKFRIFTSGSNTRWEDIHEQVLACKLFNRLDTRNTQPVYQNGSMHWLTRNGDILCFDLEKHWARIIERPVEEPSFMVSNWFGGIKDSLVYVHALEYEIVVYNHHPNAKWEIQHKVRNLYTTLDHNYRRGSIKLFNGERLLFLLGNRNENGEIYSQDISSDQTWKKVGLTEESVDYSLQFIPFVPTLARLSAGLYLHDRTTEGSLDSGVKETLIGLCKIFREDFDFDLNWRELLFHENCNIF